MAQYASSKQEVRMLLPNFPPFIAPMVPLIVLSVRRRSFPATSFPLPQSQLPFIVVLLRGNDVLAYYKRDEHICGGEVDTCYLPSCDNPPKKDILCMANYLLWVV